MKNFRIRNASMFLTMLALAIVPFSPLFAQSFQRAFGTPLDNSFSKVVQDGNFYYVLGSNEPTEGALHNATITRLNSMGEQIWTKKLEIPSEWHDAVRKPDGSLLVVGSTLPNDESGKSLMGSISSAGTFTWVNSYDVTGHENISKIVRSPSPQNPLFEYYAVGSQLDFTGNPEMDDVFLLNLNGDGEINWKKYIPGISDEDLANDLEVMANGNLLLAGNIGTSGAILVLDNTGQLINAASPEAGTFSYSDIAISNDGSIYAVGRLFPSLSTLLMKYDLDLFPLWEISILGLTEISQVWEDPDTEDVYVTARGVFDGKSRPVVLRFTNTDFDPELAWVKYLDNGETSFAGGTTSLWHVRWICYTDSRVDPVSGFGQSCAFISISDLELNTCITESITLGLEALEHLYNSPDPQPMEFYDEPQGMPVSNSMLMWQEQDVCTGDTCFAEFIFDIDCGEVSFFDQSSLPDNPDWDWTFPGGNPSSSTLQNPIVNFPCGTYEVCLTINGNGPNPCSSTICHTVVISDNVPPVVECSGVSVELDANCEAIITPATVGAAFDNCQLQSTTISPSVITNCGFTLVTFTATDWCGNTSSCSTSVFALEIEPPVVTCRPNVVVTGNGPVPCTAVVDGLSYLSASDNCELVDVSYQITGTTTGSGQDASGTTFNQGFSTITYIATDACGNTDTCSFTVTVLCETPGCCPEFDVIQLNDIMPCPGDSACLGDSSSHIPMQGSVKTIIACKNSVQEYYVVPNLPGFIYNWTVSGGTLTSLQGSNPGVITWGNGTQGFFEVIITDATGMCRDTVRQKVCLIDAPVAAFTILPGNTICTNQPVAFTNTSVGASGYFWDFGDGTGSALQNPPPHSYSTPGTYTVVLTVSNNTLLNSEFQCGCLDIATAVITVIAGEGPTISSSCNVMLCPEDIATYCVSPACAPYNWTVNGGTITANNGACITVKWDATAPATLPAFVSVTTGCPATCGGSSATLNVPVLWNGIPISGPSPVCVGSTETYSLPIMPGTFYTWTVTGAGGMIVGPDQNTPTINVQWTGPAGLATITCVYDNPYSDCMGTSSLQIDVKNKFTMSGPATVCVGTTETYNSNGNADWTITPAGNTINPPTTNVSGITVNWSTPGNYTITATPPAGAYCNLNDVIHVVVNPAPVVTITGPLVVCPNEVETYTATSSLSGANFNWTVAGGGTVSAYGPDNSNASVIFTGSGSWTLTASQTVNGCPGSSAIVITPEPLPVISPTSVTSCIGGTATVTVLPGSNGPYTWSSTPAASLISGQGTSTATYEIHGNASGNGSITVSNCSGPALNSVPVNVTMPPGVTITSTGSLCTNDLVLTANPNGTAMSYQWFGGGTPNSPSSISVTNPGTYSVQVTFTDGCISVATYTVPPEAIPTVTISTGDPLGWCIPATPNVNLQAFTLSTGCTYQWYFNGSPIAGAFNPTYPATLPGNYFVIVTCGLCVATSNTITVYTLPCNPPPGTCQGVPNPLSAITELQGNPITMCNPKEFNVVVTGCTGEDVTWSFGDGSPSVIGAFNSPGVNDVTHNYTSPGAYLVTASITCSGCTFTVHTNVNVPVVADFNTSVVCGANGSYTINLANTSQTLGGWTVTNVTWSSDCGVPPLTGQGNTFTLNTTPPCNPNVTMVITVTNPATGDVCTDSKTFPFNLPTAPLSINGPTQVCKNQTYSFFSSMTGPNIIQYEWTVNGTPPVSQEHPLSYAFDGNPVNPVVGLTVVDIFGCTFTASTTLNVVMPRTISIAPVEICPDCLPPAALTVTPFAGFANFQWYQNGLPVGTNSPTHPLCQFDASGNYYVTAEDALNNNCEVISNTVQVVYLPKPEANIHGQTVQCVSGNGPYNISLNNGGGNNFNYMYSWTATGPGGITFNPDNLQFFANASVTQLGTYQFILMVTDITTGCMAKDTFCVYLFQNPNVTVTGPVGVLCEGTPHTFTASATPAANYIYQWSNGVTGPTMTTSLAGFYSVTATNPESGCYGIAFSGLIRPQPPTILFPVGCDTICDNESITPPLALGGNWPNNPSLYTVQWFVNGNPYYTGLTLNLNGVIPPLVYGWNNIFITVTYQGCTSTSNVYNLFIKECCVCISDLTLYQGNKEYPVACDTLSGFIPSFPCPAEDVSLSGFFGFGDPATGEPCVETFVTWELLYQNISILTGTTTNYTSFIFPKALVEPPGTYCLILTTISPDGLDTCVCKVTWIQEPCPCCTTLEDFCDRFENNVTLLVDNDYCKATLDIGSLNGCDNYIEWVDWNFPSQQEGPFLPGTMPMHTYNASGTYTVCYLAIERDTDGFICFEKVICDTITVICPECYCGTFSALFFPNTRAIFGVQPFCDSTKVIVECPAIGQSILFTGNFQCSGPACPPNAPITWELFRLPNTSIPIASGSTFANPFFSISILPAWYSVPGSYEIRLTGHCGPQECPCVVRFDVNCPEPCPCAGDGTIPDQGFAMVVSNNFCRACFTPIGISDCETVEWHLNTENGPLLGSSIGINLFCHTFSNPGTYTIVMIVKRKKPDGTDCDEVVKTQTVTITCLLKADCTESVFFNPTFSEGAVAGDLGLEGMSLGWTSILGNPKVIEGQPGSNDGWTIQLWGNLDTSSILVATESICLAKDTGTLTLRINMPPPRTQTSWGKILFVQSDNVELNNCNGIDCYELASISLSELNTSEWYEIQVPYDLSQWMSSNSCAGGSGVMVRPAVYITNYLTSEQGGEDTYSIVQLDNLCGDGTIVALHDPDRNSSIRIFPNPTSGTLNIEMPFAAQSGMSLQVVNMTGQLLMEKEVEVGNDIQSMEATAIVDGMYLLQIISDGRIIALNKFVKM